MARAWDVSRVPKMESVDVRIQTVRLLLEGRIVSRQDVGGWRYSRVFLCVGEMDVVPMYAVCVFLVYTRNRFKHSHRPPAWHVVGNSLRKIKLLYHSLLTYP